MFLWNIINNYFLIAKATYTVNFKPMWNDNVKTNIFAQYNSHNQDNLWTCYF